MPKWIATPFSKPYIAGKTSTEALEKVKKINENGFSATLDILGEHVKNKDLAQNITNQYCELYNQIDKNSLDCNISIKPTHVGLSISLDEAISNISTILRQAKKYKNFLRLDMENSVYTDKTFEIYNHCKTIYNNVGIAIQSYLYRSMDDVKYLSTTDFNARICKGIYNESESICFQDRTKIKENFLSIAKTLFSNGSYSCYATHDQKLIDRILDLIISENIPSNKFEFQVLYGVPMSGRLEELKNKGYKIRIYIPFGPDWFDYSVRRLKENPDIIGYIFKNMLKSE